MTAGRTLTPKDRRLLVGVHVDLVRVVSLAIEFVEFRVTEGLRTPERQLQLMNSGASKTLKSRHLTGHAVDLVPIVGGAICWKWPAFWPMVEAVEHAAATLGVPIECGAHWKSFPDGPHVQLPWKFYP